MTKIAFPLTLLATALVCALAAAPAQAQTRTYTAVSAATIPVGAPTAGSACGSVQSPCRTLQAAMDVTAENGVIDVLDPGEYGPLTIKHAVSIQGHGWATVTAARGATAITINANEGDEINIRGVLLDGVGIGTAGIAFNAGTSLNIQDSIIRHFASAAPNAGIFFQPATSSQLFVSNTLFSDINGSGIFIFNNGSGTLSGVFEHVEIENNAGVGISVSGTGNFFLRNSTVVNNDGAALNAVGGIIRVTRSTIKGNASGWTGATGSVTSYCDNNIDDNGANNSTPGTCFTYH